MNKVAEKAVTGKTWKQPAGTRNKKKALICRRDRKGREEEVVNRRRELFVARV